MPYVYEAGEPKDIVTNPMGMPPTIQSEDSDNPDISITPITIRGGTGSNGPSGGVVNVTGGIGDVGSNGGDVNIKAGLSNSSSGGTALLRGGDGTTTGGIAEVQGGDGATGGGNVIIVAGSSGSPANPGDVILQPGQNSLGGSGHIILHDLPTVNPNVVGALWNNAGVLNVSAG